MEIEIKIQMADASIEQAVLEIDILTNRAITFITKQTEYKKFDGEDLYAAFNHLRTWLDKSKSKLLCNGARVDVTPSGMSRGMGGGRKAYIIRIGKPALREDLVDIFDYASPDKIGSLDEQKEYYERWVSSLEN